MTMAMNSGSLTLRKSMQVKHIEMRIATLLLAVVNRVLGLGKQLTLYRNGILVNPWIQL